MTGVIMLDIDGVLTTARSRVRGSTVFDASACVNLECLVAMRKPDIVVHSSWRKLPRLPADLYRVPPDPEADWWYWDLDWFRDMCVFYGMPSVAARIIGVAPYRFSSGRVTEIRMWMNANDARDRRVLVLDDDVVPAEFEDLPNVRVVKCDDRVGFTPSNCDASMEFLTC